ncbi:hypothetical protein DFR30_2215 [Thiogranum longum]|uniref:Tetratricopeptide repeat protein n=1 Tax=Thiogranum longum TaxID=1537524 RepID=A0A4R1HAG4_9GAMM|nr:hypothetical protein [Thiogranum longum]TCK18927.1 hypothetical protein DFR30_2215 [Thiogranum longum]
MRQPLATAPTQHNGQPDRRLPVFVCGIRKYYPGLVAGLCLLVYAALALAVDMSALREISLLASSGAPQLALRRMDAEQPAFANNPVDWMTWERERLQILRGQNMDAALVRRIESLPDGIDERFLHFAKTLGVESQLQLGDIDAALAGTRDLIWQHGAHAEAEQLEQWRRIVVRAYVRENRVEDARLALLRYRQDYGTDNSEWRWLSARVSLQAGHPRSALKRLTGVDDPRGRFLYKLAALDAGEETATRIAEQAAKQATDVSMPGLQRAWWSLAARAAAKANKPYDEVRYLEHALALPSDPELALLFPEVKADTLWQRYLELGQQIGNEEQRLLGNDDDWYFPATEAMEKDPLRARIFFAVLAEYAGGGQRRSLAHEYLVGLLDELPEGKQLVRTLYLEASRYAEADQLPAIVRYRLIDEALETGDLETASRLMDGLAEPPRGQDRFEWTLRRARVAIYAGDVPAGVALLQQLLAGDEADDWDSKRADRLLQILFDLQTVQHHSEALNLFDLLLEKPLETQQRRELLFWMAESLQALKQFDQAAYLYIKSATLTDLQAMDPWAQTARYRAAKALVEAGLLDDARRIYTSLMRATRDASRKAVLNSEIQRLRLLGAVKTEGK